VATSVVKYSHNVGMRTAVALVAVAIVVTAVVISKRRSSGLSPSAPAEEAPAVTAPGPDSAPQPAGGGDNRTAPPEQPPQATTWARRAGPGRRSGSWWPGVAVRVVVAGRCGPRRGGRVLPSAKGPEPGVSLPALSRMALSKPRRLPCRRLQTWLFFYLGVDP